MLTLVHIIRNAFMPEIRRTITNTFKDAQECEMFIIILKQKWSEFDGKLSDKFTVEIVLSLVNFMLALSLAVINLLGPTCIDF
ncbi:MAG: hypothetical protein EBW07_12560 [Rhodobacteraceae bacterium]|nr:hypothetical protein [Paracoccaceae bacterium]